MSIQNSLRFTLAALAMVAAAGSQAAVRSTTPVGATPVLAADAPIRTTVPTSTPGIPPIIPPVRPPTRS